MPGDTTKGDVSDPLEYLGRVISFSSPAGHGVFDGLQGAPNRRGVPTYDLAFKMGAELREAWRWYQLFKIDQENPEPT